MLKRTEPQIRVILQGGLANQLFQWAVTRTLADEFGLNPIYDMTLLDRPGERGAVITELKIMQRTKHASRPTTLSWKFLRILAGPRVFAHISSYARKSRVISTVSSTTEAKKRLANGRSVTLYGFFQEPEYLLPHRQQMREILLPALRAASQLGNICNGDYVGVHVRRGDYNLPRNKALFGVCTDAYFNRALRHTTSEAIRVCSDDIAWARENLSDESRRLIFDENTDPLSDLLTLAQSSELILSNSTFSWWAAFISDSRLVICPSPWLDGTDEDLRLPEWKVLEKTSGREIE